MGKGLEKLFKLRVTWNFNRRQQLSRRQFGFTEQTSTSDALRSAVNQIRAAKSRGEQVIAVSLDIKAAFDNAWWPSLLNQLTAKKCPINIMKLIRHYLEDRDVELTYAAVTVRKQMTKGCVQGSVCGPTFWNLILDQLFNIDLPDGCFLQAFADDVLLICYHKNVGRLTAITEEALETISRWGAVKKLTFGPEKTQVIAFSYAARKLTFKMNAVDVKVTSTIKLLGVITDRDLRFIQHAFYAVEKSQRIFRSLCRMARPTWGLSSEIIRIMYLQAVEPGLTYAASIWVTALKYVSVRKKLDQFQRPFAVKAIRGFHTTSLTSSLALAWFIPIDLRLKEIAELENVKLTATSTYVADRRCQGWLNVHDLEHPATRIAVSHMDVTDQEEINIEESRVETSIYTDGSKLDDKVGSAFVVYENRRQVTACRQKLDDHCSVFQAELTAINHALTYLIERHPRSYAVFSDSKSSLQALQQRSSVNPIVNEIQRKVKNLRQSDVNGNFFWVRAHVGITGNEAADEEAKEATLSEEPSAMTAYPISYVKQKIRENTIKAWNERYVTAETGSGTRLFLPSIYHAQQLSKKIEPSFELSQVLTGHGFNKKNLHRFKIADGDVCPCDGTSTQSITHLLEECPRYGHQRSVFGGTCLSESVDFRKFVAVIRDGKLLAAFVRFAKSIISSFKQFNGPDGISSRRRQRQP